MGNEELIQIHFITGMSRGGTTWLSRVMNTHSRVVSFGESLYWGRLFREPGNPDGTYSEEQVAKMAGQYATMRWGPHGEEAGSLHSSGTPELEVSLRDAIEAVDQPTPASVFEAISRVFLRLEGRGPVAIEKTPHHVNWIGRIREAYPDARFVAMARDAYGFMLSYKHQGDRKPPEVRDIFHRLYHPLGCAIVWRGFIRSILAAEAEHSEAVLRVDFERMKREEAAVLREVQIHFGLPVEEIWGKVEAANTSFPAGERPTLMGTDIFWMNLVAGRSMRRAGYARQKAGWPVWGVSRSIARLPVWGLTVMKHMAKVTGGSPVKYLKRWLK